MKISKKDFRKDPQLQLFEKWYDDNVNLFDEIKSLIEGMLAHYNEVSAASKIDSISFRMKTKISFIEKIKRLHSEGERHLDKIQNDPFSPTDLIKDIIGGRIVFFFEKDINRAIIYFLSYPSFNVELINAYQICPDSNPIASTEKKKLNAYIRGNSKKVSIDNKGCYESLHLLINFTPMALIHSENLNNKFESKHVGFPIEIQIRTILQHAWAQIEHQLNYSLKKSSFLNPIADANFQDDFLCYKTILKAAEHQQRILLNRFSIASFCCGKILIRKKSLNLYNLVVEDQKKRSRLCEIKR